MRRREEAEEEKKRKEKKAKQETSEEDRTGRGKDLEDDPLSLGLTEGLACCILLHNSYRLFEIGFGLLFLVQFHTYLT